jgi:asparagine synthase (glutamine-hydrolysing)
VDAGPARILEAMQLATQAMVAPYGDAVCVPWFLIGKAAADANCDALFSGEGGDQVFGGWANKPMITELALTGAPIESIYARTFHRFLDELPELLNLSATGADKPFDVYAWIRDCLPEISHASVLQTLRHLNFATKGGGTILPRFTETIETHQIDAHAPFFDTDLVATAMGMPDSAILDGPVDKVILRTLVAEMTSEKIAMLPKRGMGVPSTYWTTDDHVLSVDVKKTLSRKNKNRDSRIRQENIDKLMSGIVDAPDSYRRRRVGERIWTLYQWEIFREVHSLSE